MADDADASSQGVGAIPGDVDDVDPPTPGHDALTTPGDDSHVALGDDTLPTSSDEDPADPGDESFYSLRR